MRHGECVTGVNNSKDYKKTHNYTRFTLIDLSSLPSTIGDPLKIDTKKRTKRDTEVNKALKLKSWYPKKVCSVLKCYHCTKPRCIYSPVEESFNVTATALQQKMESVSSCLSCGDLLFDDTHHLSKILVQKQDLICEPCIEKAYFNHKDRKLMLPDICIYCGGEGAEDFLLREPQLRKRQLTEGKNCFPICTDCLKCGKKVVKSGRKNGAKARSEKAVRGRC